MGAILDDKNLDDKAKMELFFQSLEDKLRKPKKQPEKQPENPAIDPAKAAIAKMIEGGIDTQGVANRGYVPGVDNQFNPFSNGFFKKDRAGMQSLTPDAVGSRAISNKYGSAAATGVPNNRLAQSKTRPKLPRSPFEQLFAPSVKY